MVSLAVYGAYLIRGKDAERCRSIVHYKTLVNRNCASDSFVLQDIMEDDEAFWFYFYLPTFALPST